MATRMTPKMYREILREIIMNWCNPKIPDNLDNTKKETK